MTFEKVAKKYRDAFDEMPPILTTLDIENEEYLQVLEKAIDNNEPLTRNDLAIIFMENAEVLY